MKKSRKRGIFNLFAYTYFILFLFSLASCTSSQSEKEKVASTGEPMFRLLDKTKTGLDFTNVINQTNTFNVFSYMYFYNGGGVATGDFNQDGKVDVYFTSNMGSNALFLNEGGMQFKDATQQAGVAGQPGWTSGVTTVDINNDGLLDIYVSQIGDYMELKGHNQLYVCKGIKNGIPVFEDQAAQYGLDLVTFATQAVFFDYDLDGDLDMYQLNHSLHQNGTFGQKNTFQGQQHPTSGDKLMKNENGRFREVTTGSGISSTVIGYGLGVSVSDINLDGWPDIYIGNDFHENDYLYINQQNGTFKDVLPEQLAHTSRFSMGVDIADINNDGQNEILSLDMLPDDPHILKTSLGEDGFSTFLFKLGYGYAPQFARNNLQLNNGNGSFSDIAMYANVFATDWSWACLFMDFDYDGNKDIFISNGIMRRMNDIDYINFRTSDADMDWKLDNNHLQGKDLDIVEKMPRVKLPNRFYRNNGNLTFDDMAGRIEENKSTFSNGAAYADFDNDGDLDVVVNNQEDEPYIYQNMSLDKPRAGADYLQISLQGSANNRQAIGTKIVAYKGQKKILQEHFPVRGYQSSVAPGLWIGVGDSKKIDSVHIIWPDGTYKRLDSLVYNRPQTIQWQVGLPRFNYYTLHPKTENRFIKTPDNLGIDFVHEENPFVEFNRENLIPHMMSEEGPAVAIGDLNGDGKEDIFLGGAKESPSRVYIQLPNGRFQYKPSPAMEADAVFEDVDALLLDINADGHKDIVIASGGNEFGGKDEPLQPRVYINNGKAEFTRQTPFTNAYLTASCVAASNEKGDYLFFGGRSVTSSYGETPSSYLYKRTGKGTYTDVTNQLAKGLGKVGFVKHAIWNDLDADGDSDLLLALEWNGIVAFMQDGGKWTKKNLVETNSWWNMVLPCDFDQDGDIDILAGSFGENARLRPTPDQPVRMYVNDFDDNGQREQLLTYYLAGKELPFANFAELTKQMPILKKKFLYANDMAKANLADVAGKEKLKKSTVFQIESLRSMYYENVGNMTYKPHVLPAPLQFSSLHTATLLDVNGDGKQEVLLGGNFHEANIEMGYYDANYGNILYIGKNGNMHTTGIGELAIKGKVRRIKPLQVNGKTYLVIAKNDQAVEVLEWIK